METLIITIANALIAGATIASIGAVSEVGKDIYGRLKNTLFKSKTPSSLQSIEKDTDTISYNSQDLLTDLQKLNRETVIHGFGLASLMIDELTINEKAQSELGHSGINIEEIVSKRDIALKNISSDELISIKNITSHEGNITIEGIKSFSVGKS